MGVGWEDCVQAGGMVHGIHVYPALMQNKGVLSHVGTGTRINAPELASPQNLPRVAWTFVITLEFRWFFGHEVCAFRLIWVEFALAAQQTSPPTPEGCACGKGG